MTGVPVPPPVDGEPWRLLQAWLPPDDDPDRPAMTLSTATPAGGVDARTVLLSGFGPEGFAFHTDARSRKVAQLAANPAVALTFLWPGFVRQLVVTGTAHLAPDAAVAAAYRARSPYLQQLAWQNTTEFAQLSEPERLARWAAFTTDGPAEPLTPPPTWTGFVVRPDRLTFWHGNPLTASRREEYTAAAGGWVVSLLPG